MLTQAELKKQMHYAAETGEFTRLIDAGSRKAGTAANHIDKHSGYVTFQIAGKLHRAHRLAWLYVHGEFPQSQIDHVNGNRADNRICNLRVASPSQNMANMAARSSSKVGIRGVTWDARVNRFRVSLGKNGKTIRRYFGNLEEAASFARAKSIELHGEFSIHARK